MRAAAGQPRCQLLNLLRQRGNETLFRSLHHARAALKDWRCDYSETRPHFKLVVRCRAVLVISSDLAEIMRVADDIVVMAVGRLVLSLANTGIYPVPSERIMHAVVGATSAEQGGC